MRNYKEYEKLYAEYKHNFKSGEMNSKEYLLCGQLMTEIMEEVKKPRNRSHLYDEFYLGEEKQPGFLINNQESLTRLLEIATFLAAAKQIKDMKELSEFCNKYRDPHGSWVAGTYRHIIASEMTPDDLLETPKPSSGR